MEKNAADLTLMDTVTQLDSRTSELMKSRQLSAHLVNAVQTVSTAKNTADKLRKEAGWQWADDDADQHTLSHLRREQAHFKHFIAEDEPASDNRLEVHREFLTFPSIAPLTVASSTSTNSNPNHIEPITHNNNSPSVQTSLKKTSGYSVLMKGRGKSTPKKYR